MAFGKWGNIVAAREARMSDDRHGELATASAERAFDPGPLPFVDRAQDAGIDREQCKVLRLQFEEWRPLRASLDAKQLTQTRGLHDESVDAAGISRGQPEIRFDASFHCKPRSFRFEKVCIEPFQCIVPVVIAGDRIDWFGEPLERKIEI